MEPLNFEGQSVLDSRDVAKMVNKRHANLLRDIDGYIKDISTNSKLSSLKFFIPSTYTDKKGEVRKCYLIPRQGCEFIANKMTGKKGNQFTAEYVTLFNSMKQEIQSPAQQALAKFPIPKTYGEALQLAATQTKRLEEQKPKIDYYNSQMRNPGLMTTTEIAKDYGWSAQRLNKELHKRHVIFRQGKHWVLYQKYADKGYTQYEPYPYKGNNGLPGMTNNLKWTQRGKKFIYDLLAKDGIRPVVEEMSLFDSWEN